MLNSEEEPVEAQLKFGFIPFVKRENFTWTPPSQPSDDAANNIRQRR